jgi:hypothetical protein
MKNNEMQHDIESLENQLKSKTEIFDRALKKVMCLDEVRKLFHELRILKDKVDELTGQESINSFPKNKCQRRS